MLVVECLMVLLELGERARVSQHLTARRRASGQRVRFHEYEGRPATWNETGEGERARILSVDDEANAEANSETWTGSSSAENRGDEMLR